MPYLGRPVTNAGQFEIIDDISSSFNGSNTSFTLQVGGTDIQPDSANVTIVLDGVVQIPTTAYSITGSTLNFSEAPANGTGFHGVLAGQSQFIESGFITNTHISDSANISGSKINTDFSAQTVQAKIFSGMISGSAQIATDISGSITESSASFSTRVTNTESSASQLNQDLKTSASPTFTGGTYTSDLGVSGSLTVGGAIVAQEFKTEFVSASITFTSGSTIFGDTSDDTHLVTGSMNISGSLTLNDGTLTVTDNVDFNGDLDVDGTTNLDVVDIDGAVDMASTLAVADDITLANNKYYQVKATGGSAIRLLGLDNSNNIYIGAVDDAGGSVYIREDGSNVLSFTGGDATFSDDVFVSTGDARLGVGVSSVPHWGSGFDVVSVGHSSQFACETTDGADRNVYWTNNLYYDGTGTHGFGRHYTDEASMVQQRAGTIRFFTDASGTADADFNPTERMRITADGYVGIGTSSPLATFHVEHTTDDTDENGNIAMTVGGGASGNVRHYWGINNSGNYGYYGVVEHATQYVPLVLQPNGSNVGIGDTAPDARLTVNAGANDTGHITIKNSDVAHSFTSLVENDTFVDMRKYSNAEGGLNLQGFSEGERGLALSNFSTVYDTPSNGTAVDKGFQFFAYALSGTNAGNLNSNGTAFIFRVRRGDASPAVVLIDEDGDIHSDGSTSITGYDYAEMFEWEDGNTGEEDRVGYSVVFGSSGDKIRIASGSEEPIGVVSARPGVIGDNPLAWRGKWKTDEWDRKIPKLIPMVSWSYDFTRGNGEVVQKTFRTEISFTGSFLSNIPSGSSERGVPYGGSIPSNAHYYNKEESQVADDYDETRDYTTRRGRGEWDTIGLMGKIKVRTGQATGSRWIKMKDVSDSIQLWLVK